MAKVTYSSLKLKTNSNIETFKFKDTEIELLQYLPVQDKYDLIINTIEKSEENGIYSPIKLDMYFHLYLVYMYTNLSFTDKQREDETKLYDILQSNGFIDEVLTHISEIEYNTLKTFLEETVKYLSKNKQSVGYFLTSLLEALSDKISNLQEMINEMDEEKYENIINLAKTLNGGREV